MYRLTIKEALQRRGMSMEEFAKKRGVSRVSAYRCLNASNISLDKLQEIADVIGCKIKELFVEDGRVNDQDDNAGDVVILTSQEAAQFRVLMRTMDSVAKDMCAARDSAYLIADSMGI